MHPSSLTILPSTASFSLGSDVNRLPLIASWRCRNTTAEPAAAAAIDLSSANLLTRPTEDTVNRRRGCQIEGSTYVRAQTPCVHLLYRWVDPLPIVGPWWRWWWWRYGGWSYTTRRGVVPIIVVVVATRRFVEKTPQKKKLKGIQGDRLIWM